MQRTPADEAERARPPGDDLARSIIAWDVRNWSRAIPFWQRHLDATSRQPRRALALGERGGGLSLWLARQGIPVVCTDLGVSFDSARALHQRHGVAHLVTYEDQDATDITYADGAFDIVIWKSMLGALRTRDRQERALENIHRVLAPGGSAMFAENLVGSALHQRLRARFVRWDSTWRYLDLTRDRTLFDAFDMVHLMTWGVFGTMGRSERQRHALGGLDSLISPLVPSAWRYIVFGIAQKGPVADYVRGDTKGSHPGPM